MLYESAPLLTLFTTSFAWAEMRTVCANILSRYEVLEVPDQQVDFKQYITMQFATGQWKVNLVPRKI